MVYSSAGKASVINCLCKHKGSCKDCFVVKEWLSHSLQEKIEVSREVKASEGCRISVNERIDTEFIEVIGYCDTSVCDLLKFGFPIEIELENREVLFNKSFSMTNYAGALAFPEHMLKYLQKEASHEAIIVPFASCPFEEGMVISPLNTVPKSNPEWRRVILDFSFPKDGTGVNYLLPKIHIWAIRWI
jgi:hypothetical protein